MLGRMVFVLMLCVAAVFLPTVSFAGGVAVAVPSCQANVPVAVQAVQAGAYQVPVAVAAPVQVAVPVYAQVQAVQAVQLQAVQAVNAKQHAVRVQVVNQPRTALGAAVQAFRDRRFGR